MAGARVYIVEQVICTWGEIIMRMPKNGSFVKAAHDEDATKAEAGAMGDVAVMISSNRMATVTWTLQALSVTNRELAPLAASNRPRGAPLIIKPMTIKDLSDTAAGIFVFGEQAWIKKAGDFDRADDNGQVDWVFQIADCQLFTGGFPG